MTITIHDCSTAKKLIQKLTWKPCPFCGCEHLRICATPSYVALKCDDIAACGFEIYKCATVERTNEIWNRREI